VRALPEAEEPLVLARGPWELDRVTAEWSGEMFEPTPAQTLAADAAIASLRHRGSPSHDGLSGRLVSHRGDPDGLTMSLQPLRWALRLVPEDAASSVAALCITRSADGRWLAGRRAPWLASWAGRWALGAGGAVEVHENPAQTLLRELREEWSVTPACIHAEALLCLPQRLVMFVGQAWLPDGVEVTPDAEHDEFEWWPRDVERWPARAEQGLRRMARWLSP
jgi:8-oxo-dGTP diphosphatase